MRLLVFAMRSRPRGCLAIRSLVTCSSQPSKPRLATRRDVFCCRYRYHRSLTARFGLWVFAVTIPYVCPGMRARNGAISPPCPSKSGPGATLCSFAASLGPRSGHSEAGKTWAASTARRPMTRQAPHLCWTCQCCTGLRELWWP